MTKATKKSETEQARDRMVRRKLSEEIARTMPAELVPIFCMGVVDLNVRAFVASMWDGLRQTGALDALGTIRKAAEEKIAEARAAVAGARRR